MTSTIRQARFFIDHLLKRFTVAICVAVAFVPAIAQQVVVDATPGHSTNSFSPLRSLGASIDRDPLNSVKILYGQTDVQQMLTAGWGPISYRLNTELSIQAWHWNPKGNWSDSNGQGYFVGDANSSGGIERSFGYNLPHRGTTSNYGTSGGYSVIDDGDAGTYWKSDPYLDETFTGESNTLHPGWIVIDLGKRVGIDEIQIAWANPYGTTYQIQYWTGNDPIGNPAGGNWKTFPNGTVSNGQGGLAKIRFSEHEMSIEFVRVLMTASSNTCDSHGSQDKRNCLGFAINEIYLGYVDSNGTFVDMVQHRPDDRQTPTYSSSTDSWHTPHGIAKDDGEQPGFDLVFNRGLTRGLPMTIPVAMLYDNPENAANEIAYLEARGYAINFVELGEEPDGQFVLPEDDAALYVQWANAIHQVDANIKLAGPVFEGTNSDIQVWPDAQGNVSWFNRFLNYLNSHRHLGDLNVMTFEHYPFNPCDITWDNLYQEPYFVTHIMKVWRDDGLPPDVPMQITESNLAYDTAVQYMQPFGALWLADYAGSFLNAGGQALFYYQWEPLPMYHGCGGWGTFGMFNVNQHYSVTQDTSQFFTAQMLTQQWAEPVDQQHLVYPASSNIRDKDGHLLVTAYSVQRPDGQWALLLVNKDESLPHSVEVTFKNAADHSHHYFSGTVTQISFGDDVYTWHPDGQHGYANPDGPATKSDEPGGKGVKYDLPAASVTVLRGTVQ